MHPLRFRFGPFFYKTASPSHELGLGVGQIVIASQVSQIEVTLADLSSPHPHGGNTYNGN